jgi:hypothetical protein
LVVIDRLELERTQDLAVHHHFPRVDRQVCVIEAPVKRLREEYFNDLDKGRAGKETDLVRDGLVSWVMIWRNILVRERLGRGDTFARVKDEHSLQQVQRCWQ